MTRASLIVLNFEGAAVIGSCLRTLSATISDEDEIIVVDNASTDGSADLVAAEFPNVRLVRLPENTYIFGLNEGLKHATGEYVGFLNNDQTFEPGFVDELIAGFDAPDVFAVVARILDGGGGEQGSRTSGFWKHGLIFYNPHPHVDRRTDCFFAVGGQSLYRRAMLDEIGSIDPLLWPMYHEDIELSYRAWKRGWRIRYAPLAIANHLGGHSSKRVFTKADLRSFVRQNEFLTVWKNVTDRRLLAEHFALLPARLIVAAAKRDWPTLRGFGNAARRVIPTLQARRQAKQHMRLSDREVFERVNRSMVDSESTRSDRLPIAQ